MHTRGNKFFLLVIYMARFNFRNVLLARQLQKYLCILIKNKQLTLSWITWNTVRCTDSCKINMFILHNVCYLFILSATTVSPIDSFQDDTIYLYLTLQNSLSHCSTCNYNRLVRTFDCNPFLLNNYVWVTKVKSCERAPSLPIMLL